MIVTFCGHRELSDSKAVEAWLLTTCQQLIAEGAEVFYLGGYGAFDLLAAKVLRQLKRAHPPLKLILVLPYLNRRIPDAAYDETVYPPLESVPYRFAICKRNEWMADHADVIVACVTHAWGGAYRMLQYAQRRHKRLLLFQPN